MYLLLEYEWDSSIEYCSANWQDSIVCIASAMANGCSGAAASAAAATQLLQCM